MKRILLCTSNLLLYHYWFSFIRLLIIPRKDIKNIMAPLETCKQVTLDFIIKENDPEVAAVEDDVRANRKQIICKVKSVRFCNRLTRPHMCVFSCPSNK